MRTGKGEAGSPGTARHRFALLWFLLTRRNRKRKTGCLAKRCPRTEGGERKGLLGFKLFLLRQRKAPFPCIPPPPSFIPSAQLTRAPASCSQTGSNDSGFTCVSTAGQSRAISPPAGRATNSALPAAPQLHPASGIYCRNLPLTPTPVLCRPGAARQGEGHGAGEPDPRGQVPSRGPPAPRTGRAALRPPRILRGRHRRHLPPASPGGRGCPLSPKASAGLPARAPSSPAAGEERGLRGRGGRGEAAAAAAPPARARREKAAGNPGLAAVQVISCFLRGSNSD